MSNNKEMSEEDFLKKHIEEQESRGSKTQNQVTYEQPVKKDGTRVSDLQYFNFDVKELPCGQFYPTGTLFMVRPAQVREIQAYSMVDDNNFYDIVEKMNDMLSARVRIKYPDGKLGSFLEIKDQDRLFLIFLILNKRNRILEILSQLYTPIKLVSDF
jgi:ATP-dependent RNA circularization protein (DNA/RNA ligase family)